ncbi:hypothetical protein V1478_008039, partial [Vespula squamosa]
TKLSSVKFPLERGIAKSGYCVIDFREFLTTRSDLPIYNEKAIIQQFSVAPIGRIHFPTSLSLLRYPEHCPGMNPRDNAPRRHTVKHRPPTTNRTPQPRAGVVANDDNDDDYDDDYDDDDEEVEG